jgi:ribosome recycling factor
MIEELKNKISQTLAALTADLAGVRAGRATSGLVEGILIESYGQKMPLKQVANVVVQDSQSILIQPWDRSNLAAIEKGIAVSDTGLNPMNDGVAIRVNIPPLSTERREELVKLAAQKAEAAKIAVRNIRHDILEAVDRQLKNKEIGEDDKMRLEKQVQDEVDRANVEIEQQLKTKETDIRTV